MPGDLRSTASPLAPHRSTPGELHARLEAAAGGAPYLVWRDAEDHQRLLILSDERDRVTIGRSERSDIPLPGDRQVSRLHAELSRMGDDWVISDDGLSRNGTFVDGERMTGRHRLRDGELIRVGATVIAFCRPEETTQSTVMIDGRSVVTVTPAQRRVLIELCRPALAGDALVPPPTNADIAAGLVLSVDGVKTHIRALMSAFALDELPQAQKRAALIHQAIRSGAVTARDLDA